MPENRWGISPSDMGETARIFNQLGLSLGTRRFRYRAQTDRWQLISIVAGVETIVARLDPDDGWTEA